MRFGSAKEAVQKGAGPSDSVATWRRGGYTLVELLVVMAILGGVMAAVLSLFNVQSRTTHVEEDIARVQQDLRRGLERIRRDLRMTGFAIAGPVDPIIAVGDNTGLNNTDTITLNSASALGRYARIDAAFSGALSSTAPVTLTIASPEEAGNFGAGEVVRIINPAERAQPVDMPFTVTAVNAAAPSVTVVPGGNATDVLLDKGYIMAVTSPSAPDTFPNTITYCVGPSAACGAGVTTCGGGNCLFRVRNGAATGDSVVAKNIEGFQLRYIPDNTTGEADTAATPATIRAVRVTLTGRNYSTEALTQSPRNRELTTVVKIRNR